MRIGTGFDSHRLEENRKLIIGGVHIPYEKGLLGHSDADVLCHAIIDSILGALGEGDIGIHFPDTDPQWKDARSIDLLSKVTAVMRGKGFEIAWVDSTIIAEKPKLTPYIQEMKENIASAGIPEAFMNIKAKTSEGMGFVGNNEGMAAQAVCLLRPCDS